MLTLIEVLGIYTAVAAVAVYGIWRLIGRQGFIGLADTDSRLAKHFRGTTRPVPTKTPAATSART